MMKAELMTILLAVTLKSLFRSTDDFYDRETTSS
jgi:hypothetical protein